MIFLNKIVDSLLSKEHDLYRTAIITPGKRPVIFFKEILKQRNYKGILPEFFTISDFIKKLINCTEIKEVSLWLFAYKVYHKLFPSDDFGSFIKWFPTLAQDWNDMLKFSDSDQSVCRYMLDEERIKNWSENLSCGENLRQKHLDFWKKMSVFLPELKKELSSEGYMTEGMTHEILRKYIINKELKSELFHLFSHFVFCGFNAFTPVEEILVKYLMQENLCICYFQADEYYIQDSKQEAGNTLRSYLKWKEFNNHRSFNWIENNFQKKKNIKIYEVSGNIAQAKVLSQILKKNQSIDKAGYSDTAIVLLDENILPSVLEDLHGEESINITMGFPLKNLAFSNAVKKIFYLQKQLEKETSSYYYPDLLSVLQEIPAFGKDKLIIQDFTDNIRKRNMVYFSEKFVEKHLRELSYFHLITPLSPDIFIEKFITFCRVIKLNKLDDIEYENISHFEKFFIILKNQFSQYDFSMNMDSLEILLNQLVNTESIDLQGEPLQGIQVMGLLETRLLDFRRVILLSANEGKLPTGNTENSYLPFSVRKYFSLRTFLENDAVYAYHFYRLLQNSKEVHLLYNSLSSGLNTGEKSRFITQIEMESPHEVEKIIVDTISFPISHDPITFIKSPVVVELLEQWKESISPSHLVSYLYNPGDFYLSTILKIKQSEDIEEELSVRNYGNLLHYSLEFLYRIKVGKILTEEDFICLKSSVNDAISYAIKKLNHDDGFYDTGINFIQKSVAEKIIIRIINKDLELVKDGNSLEILELEKKVSADFFLDDNKIDKISFKGFIDRIDRLNGEIRIIDYKTGTADKLSLLPQNKEYKDDFLHKEDYCYAIQLCIYAYCIISLDEYKGKPISCGIFSFAQVNSGVKFLYINKNKYLSFNNLSVPMNSIRSLILEILNPAVPFIEKQRNVN